MATTIPVPPGDRANPPMNLPVSRSNRPWPLLAAGVGLLLIGGAIGAIAGKWQRQTTSPVAESQPHSESTTETNPPTGLVTLSVEQQAMAGVTVVPVEHSPLAMRTWRTGHLALHDDRIAHVCPAAEGIVRETPIRLGQTVNAGDVLAVIESRELGQAKLEAYKARMALNAERELTERTRTAMSNTAELLRLLDSGMALSLIQEQTADKPIGDYRQQLLAAFTRRKQLLAQLASQRASGGAIPESAVLKTEADAEAASAAYTALVEELRFQVKNQTRQAELKLKEAETLADVAKAKLVMFGYTKAEVEQLDPIAEGANAAHLVIRAPFAGTVVEKHAVRSERVSPQTQMFLLADLRLLWVQADVFESDLPMLRRLTDRKIWIRSLSAGIPERPATVTYMGDRIDPESRTLTLTAEAENADSLLKPGLFVEIGFDLGDDTRVMHIPSEAVLRHEGKSIVFVRDSAEQFRVVEVELGRNNGERVEIRTGLKASDRVVVRGGFVLKSELLKDQMAGE
ncbi:efflux RND transporter periplasmic adaptor subunit [Tuwongella immobilis]|uniref:Uncharacterized protein n=1 Tax=Tuwongella immobilis TaxID=692036 RepID=A0A6C2YT03_9BACT|nr:efflux RND transporter periplasmic adaptor subunit [Tuwongella immobilis]VIP04850.1 efflux rnd mfp subunit : Efflux transporter, RND family, MFP subunit OS=Rhodopirellula europaea SH398 GN=RESH_06318 PE=4 SV=1: HlyD_2 [Tuwongella immobilis]VTS07060.1 efflux rnd mfp subunit : Efflux transporter, RND family, MFP subunit OS=Rhodopirellula europaea SH398 GN=RESH_06318 PE=4 SV=1: HlyD_2 [Tuwongella immobilis]